MIYAAERMTYKMPNIEKAREKLRCLFAMARWWNIDSNSFDVRSSFILLSVFKIVERREFPNLDDYWFHLFSLVKYSYLRILY